MLISLFSLLLLIVAARALRVEECGGNIIDITSARLGSPFAAGQRAELVVEHTARVAVGNGRVTIELSIEGVKVASESVELCSVSTSCHKAPHTASTARLSLMVPAATPEGLHSMAKVLINDHNGGLLSCFEVEVRVTGVPPTLERQNMFLFDKWREEHGFNYPACELERRMRVFSDNLGHVSRSNAENGNTFKLALNQFAADDIKTLGFIGGPSNVNRSFYQLDHGDDADLPESVDWVSKGAVTPVKNQGACGSCWAFSTTGALEGAYFIKTGKLVSFSEQELVSCDTVDQGCNGGFMDQADMYIQQAGGLCEEGAYPYVGRDAACTKLCMPVTGSAPRQIIDVEHMQASLEHAVAKQPVAIAIEADQVAFKFYKKGVLTGLCGTTLDHGVLATGYGTTSDGIKFWRVKNSWGPAWGDNGYINIQRGKPVKGGECGLLLSASYPTL
jgi:hypothetical protein